MPEAVRTDAAPRETAPAGPRTPPSGEPPPLPDWLTEAFAKRGLEPHDGWPPAHHLLGERDLPWEEDEEDMAVATAHERLGMDVGAGLERRYRDRRDALVARELLVYFDSAAPSRTSARRVSPDLLVAFGVPRRDRTSFAVWEEGRAPDFVLEILSAGTWRRDVGEKVALYRAMGVREYFLFDPHGRAEPRLQAWAYRPFLPAASAPCYPPAAAASFPPAAPAAAAFPPAAPAAAGPGPKPPRAVHPVRTGRALPARSVRPGMRGVYSEALGLWLCHTDPWPSVEIVRPDAGKLRWFDPAADRLLETYQEMELRQAEAIRASEAGARAAEARADALRAELDALQARLRGDR